MVTLCLFASLRAAPQAVDITPVSMSARFVRSAAAIAPGGVALVRCHSSELGLAISAAARWRPLFAACTDCGRARENPNIKP